MVGKCDGSIVGAAERDRVCVGITDVEGEAVGSEAGIIVTTGEGRDLPLPPLLLLVEDDLPRILLFPSFFPFEDDFPVDFPFPIPL